MTRTSRSDDPAVRAAEEALSSAGDRPAWIQATVAVTAARPYVEREVVKAAFVAGFRASCEGWNGEYPPDLTAEDILEVRDGWRQFVADLEGGDQ